MTTSHQQLPGTWASDISPALVANSRRINDVRWHDAHTLVWVEGRGKQGVIVQQRGAHAPYDLTASLSVGGRVGYGGGEFSLQGGDAFFSAGGRLYRQVLGTHRAQPITPQFGGYASPAVSPDGRWVAFVQTYDNADWLALTDRDGAQLPHKLAHSADFVMSPAWHPDSRRLAYVEWDHPNMPWDGTRLIVLTLDADGAVVARQAISGDESTAIVQPQFSPDGRYLSYISDASGIGQIVLHDLITGKATAFTADAQADHGFPAWVQGIRVYGWLPDSSGLIYRKNRQGIMSLWHGDLASGDHREISASLPFTAYQQIDLAPDGTVAVIASGAQVPACLVTFHPQRVAQEGYTIRARTLSQPLPPELFAPAQALAWQGEDGETVHGLYYPPTNPACASDSPPPLIVEIHGGPTSQRVADFQPEIQFYTSRGYAVLSVNHRGSTGYGRAYMNRLRGEWGVVDVADAASGAHYAVAQGLADPQKLVIMGGSAGGYTVLQSLVTRPGLYRAGVCKYGISNLFALVEDTHKFEARYTDTLSGALPEALATYRERSPLFNAQAIRDAVIIFQGDEDTVVPRNQSDSIVETLRTQRVPHEYHVYAGEGHGWRKPETIDHYLNAVLAFLKRHVVYR